jgi:MerR family transcriptional regulator, light-induced transcriptional regulator
MASLSHKPIFDLCGEGPSMDVDLRGATFAKNTTGSKGVSARTRLDEAGAKERSRRARHERSEHLARIIDGEIIPRLLLAHQATLPAPAAVDAATALDAEAIDRYALIAISASSDSLLAVIGGLLQQGVPLETIFLDLLAPTARRVGDFWLEDRVSFADVTIALGRLQKVVRDLSLHGSRLERRDTEGRSVLLAAAPGEQHTFGVVVVEELFRRAGWRTWTELSGDESEILGSVQSHRFDMFGVTASAEHHLDQVSLLIKSVRRASKNRDITIMVGGLIFTERPELAAAVGADGSAADARQAVLMAEGAVRQVSRR